MKSWTKKSGLAYIAATLFLSGQMAHASGGTITFVGAIAAPTCSTIDSHADTTQAGKADARQGGLRFVCGGRAASGERPTQVMNVTTVQASGLVNESDLVRYVVNSLVAIGYAPSAFKLTTVTYN